MNHTDIKIVNSPARFPASRGLRFGIASILLILLIIFQAPEASAYVVHKSDDEVTGLMTLSPTSVELDVVPGQILYQEATIANRTGQTLSVDLLTEDFEGSDDPNVPAIMLGSEDSPQGAKTWLQPEVNKLTINQGETVTLKIRISVPPDAAPGGHYGMFLASFNTVMAGSDGVNMNVISRAGCYFLLRVAGPVDERGSLDPPYINKFLLSGPVTIGLQFNNQGTIHLKPSGTVRIKNLLGMTVAEIPVTAWTVMPNASRYTEVTWDRDLFFGRYTVEAMVNYGDESKELVSSNSFWAFSWIILLVLLILLIIVLLIIFWLWIRRSHKRKYAASRAQEDEIRDGLAVARFLIDAGKNDEARSKLQEIRLTAHELGLYHEVVMIDDLLLTL